MTPVTTFYGSLRDHELPPCSASPSFRVRVGSMFLAVGTSPLSRGIGGVLLTGSKKEMRRIGAWGLIALVAHKKPIWDLPKMQQPADAVRSVLMPSNSKSSVSISPIATHPIPALLRSSSLDVRPKTFLFFLAELRQWFWSLWRSFHTSEVRALRSVKSVWTPVFFSEARAESQ